MVRKRVDKVLVRRMVAGEAATNGAPTLDDSGSHRAGFTGRTPDRVVVEEPMEIRLEDTLVATTMRTPGNDYELAVGYCFTEGLLGDAPVVDVRYCALGAASDANWNIVTVSTGGRSPEPTPRLTAGTSACGWCGSDSIDALSARLTPLPERRQMGPPERRQMGPPDLPDGRDDELGVHPIDWELATAVGDLVAQRQPVFDATGGSHAAAAFWLHNGSPLLIREDVGRHNAVDKVIGRLCLDGLLPASDLGLWVSSRLGYEIAAKAWAAGFAAVIAVGPASSLAIETAARANLPLAGFARSRRNPGPLRVTVPSSAALARPRTALSTFNGRSCRPVRHQ